MFKHNTYGLAFSRLKHGPAISQRRAGQSVKNMSVFLTFSGPCSISSTLIPDPCNRKRQKNKETKTASLLPYIYCFIYQSFPSSGRWGEVLPRSFEAFKR